MAQVIVKEPPGGARLDEAGNAIDLVYVCPTCSRGYQKANDRGERVEIPRTCHRCGSPMDIEKGKDFAQRMAEQAANQTTDPAAGRRTETI